MGGLCDYSVSSLLRAWQFLWIFSFSFWTLHSASKKHMIRKSIYWYYLWSTNLNLQQHYFIMNTFRRFTSEFNNSNWQTWNKKFNFKRDGCKRCIKIINSAEQLFTFLQCYAWVLFKFSTYLIYFYEIFIFKHYLTFENDINKLTLNILSFVQLYIISESSLNDIFNLAISKYNDILYHENQCRL